MSLESASQFLENVSDLGKPDRDEVESLIRPIEPEVYRFPDDGETPNNPFLPVLIYRDAICFDPRFDPAAVLEEIFAAHRWGETWRDGIYDYLHFHSGTHEVLGIARGSADIELGGGVMGMTLSVAAGDVLVLPAGTGHRRLDIRTGLLVVGAYPAGGTYDEPRPREIDHIDAVDRIAAVTLPAEDPLRGAFGPLVQLWGNANADRMVAA